jgi:hypothetical protein
MSCIFRDLDSRLDRSQIEKLLRLQLPIEIHQLFRTTFLPRGSQGLIKYEALRSTYPGCVCCHCGPDRRYTPSG